MRAVCLHALFFGGIAVQIKAVALAVKFVAMATNTATAPRDSAQDEVEAEPTTPRATRSAPAATCTSPDIEKVQMCRSRSIDHISNTQRRTPPFEPVASPPGFAPKNLEI
jgi:hypothetical protein